jgi:hypothetical protein
MINSKSIIMNAKRQLLYESKFSYKTCLKLVFKLICLMIMCYQIVCVTLNYLSFPYNVNLYLTDDQNRDLPSITICFTINPYCIFDNNNNDQEYKIKREIFTRILPQNSIECNVILKNNQNNINCNQIANTKEMFIVNTMRKCFVYFQKRETFYQTIGDNNEIDSIKFLFNNTLILRDDMCFYKQ